MKREQAKGQITTESNLVTLADYFLMSVRAVSTDW